MTHLCLGFAWDVIGVSGSLGASQAAGGCFPLGVTGLIGTRELLNPWRLLQGRLFACPLVRF